MRNLKMRVKMIVCFGIILLLIVMLNAGSLINLRQISDMVPELYNGPHQNSVTSLAVSRELYRMDGIVKSMILSGNASSYGDEFDKAHTALDADLAALAASNPDAKADVTLIEASIDKMNEAREAVARAVNAKQEAQALSALASFTAALTEASQASDALALEASNSAKGFLTDAEKKTNTVIIVQDILFALILAACIGTALKLSVDVTRPVKKLANGMDEIAQGHLSARIENPHRDELGVLASQMNETMGNLRDYIKDISRVLGEMGNGDFSVSVTRDYIGDFGEIKESMLRIIDSLNHTLSQIKICCSQVRGGSEALAVSAESLAQGAVEQATALEGFQSSMRRAETIAVRNGENAMQIQGLSEQASDTVVASDAQMQQMSASMEQINESSKEIAKVIKIIEDIAFQTNILALNAAVEAARAGAAGKGFAVVADEVRNLASKSAEAAKNTTSMISKAVNAVDGGMKNAAVLSTTMQQVKDCVNSMEHLLDEIGKSTKEQSEAFQSMAGATDQISAVVHRNSAAAEENSSASEELSSQAEILDGLVERFQLKDENGR